MEKGMAEPQWKSLYRLGGITALAAALVMLSEIFITLLPGGGATGIEQSADAASWFALFQDSWFMGLRNLGLINMIAVTLGIPAFLALYGAHRETHKTYAALAFALFLIGAGAYFATNTAFAMFSLSAKHASAATQAQRASLLAAGEALLARGESHTPGTYVAFLMNELSGITIALVMLKGKVFKKAAGWFGIAGFGCLFLFEALASFAPPLFSLAMVFAVAGGVSSITWYVFTGVGLLKLAVPDGRTGNPAATAASEP